MGYPRCQATRSIMKALAFKASQNDRRTVMLAHDKLLTSLLAGSPRQSKLVRVMICPNATDGRAVVI